MRTGEATFWWVSLGKLFLNSWSIWRIITTTESDLNKFVLAKLLKPISVMDNFLEDFQEFNKKTFPAVVMMIMVTTTTMNTNLRRKRKMFWFPVLHHGSPGTYDNYNLTTGDVMIHTIVQSQRSPWKLLIVIAWYCDCQL